MDLNWKSQKSMYLYLILSLYLKIFANTHIKLQTKGKSLSHIVWLAQGSTYNVFSPTHMVRSIAGRQHWKSSIQWSCWSNVIISEWMWIQWGLSPSLDIKAGFDWESASTQHVACCVNILFYDKRIQVSSNVYHFLNNKMHSICIWIEKINICTWIEIWKSVFVFDPKMYIGLNPGEFPRYDTMCSSTWTRLLPPGTRHIVCIRNLSVWPGRSIIALW